SGAGTKDWIVLMMDNTPEETVEMPEELTTEQILANGDPEMAERLRNAGKGLYEHTLIEIWENDLRRELEGYADQASMDTYDQFLRSWSWLKYSDVEKCRRHLLRLTQESMDAFDEALDICLKNDPRTREQILDSNETDWKDNKAIYLEIIAQWSALVTRW